MSSLKPGSRLSQPKIDSNTMIYTDNPLKKVADRGALELMTQKYLKPEHVTEIAWIYHFIALSIMLLHPFFYIWHYIFDGDASLVEHYDVLVNPLCFSCFALMTCMKPRRRDKAYSILMVSQYLFCVLCPELLDMLFSHDYGRCL